MSNITPQHQAALDKTKDYWIFTTSPIIYNEYWISNKDPKTLSDDEDFMGVKNKKHIRVIDYSEYQTVLNKIETLENATNIKEMAIYITALHGIIDEMKSTLDKYKEVGIVNHSRKASKAPTSTTHFLAEETLASVDQKLGEIK